MNMQHNNNNRVYNRANSYNYRSNNGVRMGNGVDYWRKGGNKSGMDSSGGKQNYQNFDDCFYADRNRLYYAGNNEFRNERYPSRLRAFNQHAPPKLTAEQKREFGPLPDWEDPADVTKYDYMQFMDTQFNNLITGIINGHFETNGAPLSGLPNLVMAQPAPPIFRPAPPNIMPHLQTPINLAESRPESLSPTEKITIAPTAGSNLISPAEAIGPSGLYVPPDPLNLTTFIVQNGTYSNSNFMQELPFVTLSEATMKDYIRKQV